jgi:hypothetical protein
MFAWFHSAIIAPKCAAPKCAAAKRAALKRPGGRRFRVRGEPERRWRRLWVEAFEDRRMLAAAFAEFVDPHSAIGNQFGATVLPLGTGNVVITSPYDDAGGSDAGAVYLFSGRTGELISTLTGSQANDHVGSGGVTALTNGNFVVLSPDWDSDTVVDASAATWGSGMVGVQGVVSAANSLVGSTSGDRIGINPFVVNAVTPLTNGNYVLASPNWDNGDVMDAGAVTWGDGTVGVRGSITEANSLVGTGTSDLIGKDGVVGLTNGNYVVASADWSVQTGAATFGDGQVGVRGQISVTNSLVGGGSGDQIGSTVTALPNGNYLVRSSSWNSYAGAVTFGMGTTGTVGIVSGQNSLVGSASFDFINANGGVRVFSNGNYLVLSPLWNDSRGAVTFGSGTSGVSGEVSAANSLVGSTANDQVGSGDVAMLTNGNYVVSSPLWDNGAVTDVGAVTFGDGTNGMTGPVSLTNSLIGSSAGDQVGRFGARALTNGNYVVDSPYWSNGAATKAGAVTLGDGTTGMIGIVSAANSLVGSAANDQVGGGVITVLTNGNYVVRSPLWDNGNVQDAGAVTLGDGASGIVGVVSAANSLVGSAAGDQVGSSGVAALTNGNYVVKSGLWDNGAVQDVGAVTFGLGASGVVGPVSSSNSLIGSAASDQVGSGLGFTGVLPLLNGSYIVLSPKWDNGAAPDAGAVTFGRGSSGMNGAVDALSSLVGITAGDQVGGGAGGSLLVRRLTNGNYVVGSRAWDNGLLPDAGAVTFGNGISGTSGPIAATNSVVGGAANTNLQAIAVDDVNQTFYAVFLAEEGGHVRVGSQIDGFAHHWHLAARPTDVNNDGHVAAGDALDVINYVNARFPTDVAADAALGKPYGFLDVNGDDFVAPNDALDVINAINAEMGGGGEGEGSGFGVQGSGAPEGDKRQGTGDREADAALMMLLAMDSGTQARRRM